MTPQRIQLKRTKGWRMPAGTVKVDRTTKWGNPFKVGPGRAQDYAVNLFARMLQGQIALVDEPSVDEQMAYREMIRRDAHELKGKNLACWCRPDQKCHADVLLQLKPELCSETKS